ncbi:Uma2 family endonuclease [Kitasatospora sp. NPDC096147]|uniref:Uma2 family endonuclease n=1 Tax=Kitasatospora sp. NPDC096147 TaxID=3364093 RepID=UPI00380E9158
MDVTQIEHTGPWTVEEVLALPESPHGRVELVGGALLLSPDPGLPHRRAALRLAMLLSLAVDEAQAPLEVLEAVRLRVPDGLLVPDLVIAGGAGAGPALGAEEAAVVVEIASPATRVADRKLKPALYAAAGIPHYWRVELDPVPRFHLGRLDGGRYADRLVQLGESTDLDDPFPLDLDPAALHR